MINVCAVIVTFNRLNILKKCLRHLLNQKYSLTNIIIIDNASTDGTNQYLKKLHNPIIKYKILNKNIGGSGGFSLGTKIAYEQSNADYFWLMDDDSLPTFKSLYELIKATKNINNKFGFLCSNVRSLNNIPVNIPTVSHEWTKYLPKGLIKISHASFVSLFVPRYIVKKLGLPIKQMFIWGDDIEYTTRISTKYESYFVPSSIIVHDSIVVHNSKSNNDETIFNSNRAKFYEFSTRNYLFTSRKYYGIKGITKNVLGDIYKLIRIPFLAKDHRMLRFYYIFSGMIKGLFFNPTIDFPNIKRQR